MRFYAVTRSSPDVESARHDDFLAEIKRIRNVGTVGPLTRRSSAVKFGNKFGYRGEKTRANFSCEKNILRQRSDGFRIGTKIRATMAMASHEFVKCAPLKDARNHRSGFYFEIFFHMDFLLSLSLPLPLSSLSFRTLRLILDYIGFTSSSDCTAFHFARAQPLLLTQGAQRGL